LRVAQNWRNGSGRMFLLVFVMIKIKE